MRRRSPVSALCVSLADARSRSVFADPFLNQVKTPGVAAVDPYEPAL